MRGLPSAKPATDGVAPLIDLLRSEFDQSVCNACTAVAKLASASESTRHLLASNIALLQALFAVITSNMSVVARTNAALALSELAEEPAGQVNLVLHVGKGDEAVLALANLTSSMLAHGYLWFSLSRYWCVAVAVR
jgi:hypothetical protein